MIQNQKTLVQILKECDDIETAERLYLSQRRVINTLNYIPKEKEPFMSISKTVPDQTMTIRQILDRYARGLTFDQGKVPIYDEDENTMFMPDMKNLDLADQQQLREAIREEVADVKKRHEAALRSNKNHKQPSGVKTQNSIGPPDHEGDRFDQKERITFNDWKEFKEFKNSHSTKSP